MKKEFRLPFNLPKSASRCAVSKLWNLLFRLFAQNNIKCAVIRVSCTLTSAYFCDKITMEFLNIGALSQKNNFLLFILTSSKRADFFKEVLEKREKRRKNVIFAQTSRVFSVISPFFE